MQRVIGVLGGLAMCLALTAPVRGHFLFIALVERPGGGRVAEVYFSDNAEAGDPQFIDKIAGTRLWLQDPPGKFEPIKTQKLEDRLRAAVPEKGSYAVVGRCVYGVLPRQTPFLLRHFPKAVAGPPEEWQRFKPSAEVPLEILSTVDNGKLQLTVLRQGKPLPQAEISTLAKDLSGERGLKCDASGRLTWQPPKAGWYMVYTSDFRKEAGKEAGKDYAEIRDFASLSFFWP
jgi:hypothetical protein